MRDSIENPSVLNLLMVQLKMANVSWLDISPHRDFVIGDHIVPVFSGALSKHAPDQRYIMDAWLISAGGVSAYYNRDIYPNASDAVAQHIGRLAMEGRVKIVLPGDAAKPRRRASKKKPAGEDKPNENV